jgi:hypothetical protein
VEPHDSTPVRCGSYCNLHCTPHKAVAQSMLTLSFLARLLYQTGGTVMECSGIGNLVQLGLQFNQDLRYLYAWLDGTMRHSDHIAIDTTLMAETQHSITRPSSHAQMLSVKLLANVLEWYDMSSSIVVKQATWKPNILLVS